MTVLSSEQKIHYTLRIACAMCFIGHGAFGIITKDIWCNYFGVFGIGHVLAYQLMPLVGTLDILLGISLLVYPMRAVTGWLVAWGLLTASLRPASGEPFAEMIERAGNYGAPLALLVLHGNLPGKPVAWVARLHAKVKVSAGALTHAEWCLRIVVCMLLAGHGWLNVIEKKSILAQYTSLGFSNASATAHITGILEIIAAICTLIYPARHIIILFFLWKMVSELFYPHWELFEWIERGGSYGCILALWFALKEAPLRRGIQLQLSR